MATSLPGQLEFTGNEITEGDFKIAQSNMLSFLSGLLGSDGEALTARKKLQIPLAVAEEKTADYATTAADTGKVLRFSGSTALSLSLDAATALGNGWNLTVINDSTADLTITPYTGDSIDGESSLVIGAGLRTAIVCDGTRLMTTYKQEEPVTGGFQCFTQNGTFTVPEGVTRVCVVIVGGSGGGSGGYEW